MKLGIIMDPINEIDIKKDSSFAMLLAAGLFIDGTDNTESTHAIFRGERKSKKMVQIG